MESTGLNLIAGAIIITVFITGIGMSIYEGATKKINESVTSSMTTQEKDALNSQFTRYEGSQTGSKVKDLIEVLIANASTYENEVYKIPKFTIGDKVNQSGDEVEDAVVESADDNIDNYVTKINKIKNKIEEKHTYMVEVTYNVEGLIYEITIYYENN